MNNNESETPQTFYIKINKIMFPIVIIATIITPFLLFSIIKSNDKTTKTHKPGQEQIQRVQADSDSL